MATKKTHVIGSGNVFEDLGHPQPAEALAKAELASLDRPVRFLVRLGSDVEIVVKPRARAGGRARVRVA